MGEVVHQSERRWSERDLGFGDEVVVAAFLVVEGRAAQRHWRRRSQVGLRRGVSDQELDGRCSIAAHRTEDIRQNVRSLSGPQHALDHPRVPTLARAVMTEHEREAVVRKGQALPECEPVHVLDVANRYEAYLVGTRPVRDCQLGQPTPRRWRRRGQKDRARYLCAILGCDVFTTSESCQGALLPPGSLASPLDDFFKEGHGSSPPTSTRCGALNIAARGWAILGFDTRSRMVAPTANTSPRVADRSVLPNLCTDARNFR